MTDQTPLNPQSRERSRPGRRRPALYRSILSLALAAIVAAWLPFSLFYIAALDKRATTVSAITAPQANPSTTRVITTASGATRLVAAKHSPNVVRSAPTVVTTRTS